MRILRESRRDLGGVGWRPVAGGGGGGRQGRGRGGSRRGAAVLGQVDLVLVAAVLVLFVLAVALDVLAEGAGVGVALGAADNLAAVGLLKNKNLITFPEKNLKNWVFSHRVFMRLLVFRPV